MRDKWVLLRDGKEVMTGRWFEVMAYIHEMHSYSFDHAVKHEGYAVKAACPVSGCGEPAEIGEICEACAAAQPEDNPDAWL